MSTLAPLLREIRARAADRSESGVAPTGVPGVSVFWVDEPVPRAPLLYSAGIVIVGQGHKIGYLGDRRFRYDAESCLVLGVPVPFECETHATPEEPLLGLRVDVELASLHGLVARFAGRLGFEQRDSGGLRSGVEPVAMEGDLLRATVRLLESLRDPMDRQVVGPAAVEEIVYRVLRSDRGRVLYDLTRHDTPYSNVARALERMHSDYRQSLSVAVAAIDQSLRTLGLDTVDLMIIHSPQPWAEFGAEDRYLEGNREAWRALEEAYEAGKLRAIGVSNFETQDLDNILGSCSVEPMVNQILAHVSNTPEDLIRYTQGRGILVEAYSPIAHGELLKNQVVADMAERYGVSVPQLSIRYTLQLGLLPLPKTANPAHMRDNAEVDFVISDADMDRLRNVDPIEDYGEASAMPVFANP